MSDARPQPEPSPPRPNGGTVAPARPEDGDAGARVPEHVLRVRLGHGANCSSIGSVVDTLFLTATVGAAVFAAVAAALQRELPAADGGARTGGPEGLAGRPDPAGEPQTPPGDRPGGGDRRRSP